jgi:hypothetical protein
VLSVRVSTIQAVIVQLKIATKRVDTANGYFLPGDPLKR